MNFRSVSDDHLVVSTKALVADERRITAEILHHLREIEARRLHHQRGYKTLFEFCVQELGYSEPSAHRRIEAMRLIKAVPEVEGKILEGALTLSAAAQAQGFFRRQEVASVEEKREILKTLENKSYRECERELIKLAPESAPPEKVRPIDETRSELRIVVDDELLAKLEKLQALLSHKFPKRTFHELLNFMADEMLEKLDPIKTRSKRLVSAPEVESPRSGQPEEMQEIAETRAIKRVDRARIWKRAESRCEYLDDKTSRRCSSTHRLEIDHIRPHAMGGSNNPTNLRLLCKAHNQLEAIRRFGRHKIESHFRQIK